MGFLSGLLGGGKTPQVTYTPFNVTGPMGSFTTKDGSSTLEMSPELQALYGQMGGLAGGYFSQAQALDPKQAAAQAYLQMEKIAAPERERQQEKLFGRIAGMGTMGLDIGGEGQPMMRAFATAQAQAANERMMQAIGLGQDLQNQYLQRGLSTMGGFLQAGQAPMGMAQLGAQMGGMGMQAQIANQQAAQQASSSKLGFLTGLAGTVGGAFLGGPLGASLGSKIGDWVSQKYDYANNPHALYGPGEGDLYG